VQGECSGCCWLQICNLNTIQGSLLGMVPCAYIMQVTVTVT
jgi:hypothetical protein